MCSLRSGRRDRGTLPLRPLPLPARGSPSPPDVPGVRRTAAAGPRRGPLRQVLADLHDLRWPRRAGRAFVVRTLRPPGPPVPGPAAVSSLRKTGLSRRPSQGGAGRARTRAAARTPTPNAGTAGRSPGSPVPVFAVPAGRNPRTASPSEPNIWPRSSTRAAGMAARLRRLPRRPPPPLPGHQDDRRSRPTPRRADNTGAAPSPARARRTC